MSGRHGAGEQISGRMEGRQHVSSAASQRRRTPRSFWVLAPQNKALKTRRPLSSYGCGRTMFTRHVTEGAKRGCVPVRFSPNPIHTGFNLHALSSRPSHEHPTVTRSSLPVETMEPAKHRQDERIICLAARITTQSLSWLYADSTTPPLPPPPPPQPPPPAAALVAVMTVPAVPLVPSRLGKPRRGLTVAGASGTRRAGSMRCSKDPAGGRYPTFCHQPQVVE